MSWLYRRLSIIGLIFLVVPIAQAITLEELRTDTNKRDFVILPARREVQLERGETYTTRITVLNRLGRTATFTVGVEDMMLASDPREAIVLGGEEAGPYSLKAYLTPGERSFTLAPGEAREIPITIALPIDAPVGGLYGAVTVGVVNESRAGMTAELSNRAAALLFVRIKGPVIEQGKLVSFGLIGSAWRLQARPLTFHFSYHNTGSVYVNPYGYIQIKNMFGQEVELLPVEPGFVLPGSTRLREITWQPGYRFGLYRAELSLNRGYENIVDERSRWVVLAPWPLLIPIGIVFLCGLYLIRRMVKYKQ